VSTQRRDHRIRETRAAQLSDAALDLEPGDAGETVDEPSVDAAALRQRCWIHAVAQSVEQREEPAVVRLVDRLGAELPRRRLLLLERPQRLDERGLEGTLDRHHLARRGHLCAEPAVAGRELVKRPTRNLHDAVIDRRFECGEGAARDLVADLLETPADRHFGRDPRDGIARSLRSQRRRPADAGVDLDHVVLRALRIQRELDVASALDAERADDADRRRAEHLMVPVGERLRGRDHDRVARVDAHRIEVLHVADGDARVRGVTHHLVLDLLPSPQRPFDQHLVDR
jgi:hypothetical protein